MENTDQANSSSDSGRKVVAAIVGIFLIVLLVLTAKWIGDQIRSRLVKPTQPIAVVEQPKSENLLGDNTQKVATYSAIPKTGPNDWLYAVAGIMLFAGFGAKQLSKHLS